MLRSCLVVLAVTMASPAAAGVSAFRLSELVTASPTADPAARYIELEALGDGCWFPSTVVRVYDPAGGTLGDAMPFASTTCFTAGTYLLFATPAAQAVFMTAADTAIVPVLPAAAGQLCLVSSTTRYDCVRWGTITTPVHDLFGPADDTTTLAAPGGLALARVADVNVVAADWRVESPTPRRPNDGTPWDPGDAGVDASPATDAGGDDAGRDGPAPIDAPFAVDAARVDANDRFLDLDPGGGASCGCGAGASTSAAVTALLVVLALTGKPRARRR